MVIAEPITRTSDITMDALEHVKRSTSSHRRSNWSTTLAYLTACANVLEVLSGLPRLIFAPF